jgi:simple sugar transport system substrate-binding protein
MFKTAIRIALSVLTAASLSAGLASCGGPKTAVDPGKPFHIAVFVPGVVQGSPTYEMMVAGVNAARDQATAAKREVVVKVVEGGFNQGDWQKGIQALAATGEYDLIVSSNPSLPDIAAAVAKQTPAQHFLVLDGDLAGNAQIKTVAFNQFEQGYLNGYFAALLSKSPLPKANPDLVVGLLAGQEYPVMNDQIKAGYLAGAQAVDPGFKIDFRVLGNWYDAAKAATLAKDMIAAKADVILTIAGGGNQGVITAAQEAGAYVMWFDSPGYLAGSGTVMGSTMVNQAAACTEAVLKALDGKLDYGTVTRLGIKEGAVGFAFDSPDLPKDLPAAAIEAEKKLIEGIKAGSVTLPVPGKA